MPSAPIALTQSRALFMPKSRSKVVDLWRGLGPKDAVCFDVDSTVVVDEFIDELAAYCGVGNQVEEVTKRAMGGKMNFRVALKERLDIIRPSVDQIKSFMSETKMDFTPGIRDLIRLLHAKKVTVYLISGGFKSLIVPIAEELGIPEKNVIANVLLFNFQGDYMGFDENEPTSASGGKALAVAAVRESKNHRHVVMVGDGATDAEACPPANAFIGFGGNVVREGVKQKCFYYAHSFGELSAILRMPAH